MPPDPPSGAAPTSSAPQNEIASYAYACTKQHFMNYLCILAVLTAYSPTLLPRIQA